MKDYPVTCPCKTVFNLAAQTEELAQLEAGKKIRIKVTCPGCKTSYRPEVWMDSGAGTGNQEKRVRIDRLGPNVRIGSGK